MSYLLDNNSKSEILLSDINNPKTMNPVLEGDKLMKEVLNGG